MSWICVMFGQKPCFSCQPVSIEWCKTLLPQDMGTTSVQDSTSTGPNRPRTFDVARLYKIMQDSSSPFCKHVASWESFSLDSRKQMEVLVGRFL